MAKLVTIELDEETGNFSVDLTGFQGKGCADVVKAFETLGTVTTSHKKPEYNAVQTKCQTAKR